MTPGVTCYLKSDNIKTSLLILSHTETHPRMFKEFDNQEAAASWQHNPDKMLLRSSRQVGDSSLFQMRCPPLPLDTQFSPIWSQGTMTNSLKGAGQVW